MPDFSFPPITTHGKTHSAQWAQNTDLVEYTLNVLERLARRYRDEPALHSIEVLNEPVSWSVFHSTSNTAKDSHEASGSTYVSLRFLKRFYRDAYARLRAVLRPETVIVFHDGFRLLRWGGWFRRAGMRNVMLDTHQYLIAMEDPLFSGPARRRTSSLRACRAATRPRRIFPRICATW